MVSISDKTNNPFLTKKEKNKVKEKGDQSLFRSEAPNSYLINLNSYLIHLNQEASDEVHPVQTKNLPCALEIWHS